MLWAVIIAGGSGERFWPKSRRETPKQLLPITDKLTMIQLTVNRLDGIIPLKNIIIITNSLQRNNMVKQLPGLNPQNIIAEPMGRDTAAAVGLGAILIERMDSAAVMFVLPADQVIHDVRDFQSCIKESADLLAKKNALLTFGINPAFPATGYGYLNFSDSIEENSRTKFFKVSKFVEKPDFETAKQYMDSGKYLWNSGMFLWKTATVLAEIKRQMPELYKGLVKINEDLAQGIKLSDSLSAIYPTLIKKSIDYGIMENAANVICAKAEFDWDDVGSWEAVEKHFKKDENGNVCIGNVKLVNCSNMLVYNMSDNNSIVAAAIDLHDQILVQTDDAVLCCPKTSAQKVKNIIEILKAEKLERFL
ncbi:MAG: hypothetical protein ACD_79C01449G0003 [uncultured bacterium]|nr:MAG: hypothetical protein ACD_79C01449G0003 [uncultured bacterium]